MWDNQELLCTWCTGPAEMYSPPPPWCRPWLKCFLNRPKNFKGDIGSLSDNDFKEAQVPPGGWEGRKWVLIILKQLVSYLVDKHGNLLILYKILFLCVILYWYIYLNDMILQAYWIEAYCAYFEKLPKISSSFSVFFLNCSW